MVNIFQLKLTNLQQRILRLLYIKVGSEINQRQISKILDVSAAAVLKALPGLSDLVDLHQDKESRRWNIKLNLSHHNINMKRVDNLKQVYESGLLDCLDKELPGSTIILFGSYSKGEDTISLDIDIAVIGRKEKKLNLSSFNRLLQREIRLNFYDSFEKIHKNLRENILNGIILAGGIKL